MSKKRIDVDKFGTNLKLNANKRSKMKNSAIEKKEGLFVVFFLILEFKISLEIDEYWIDSSFVKGWEPMLEC